MRRDGWISSDAIGPGCTLNEQGQVVPNLHPDSFLYVDEDGYINSRLGPGVRIGHASPPRLLADVPDLSAQVAALDKRLKALGG